MSIELKMPALSPTMEKGTLAKWMVRVGDKVSPGDMIAEIETDKASMEFEAEHEGQVVELIIPEGTSDVPVGTVLALLSSANEIVETGKAVASSATPAIAPIVPTQIEATPADQNVVAFSRADEKINATPLARRIAAVQNIALSGIKGSGARGRIVRDDVISKPASRSAPALAVVASAPAAAIYGPPDGVPHDVIKLSTMRRTIARRLSEAKQTIPHFYLTARCRLDTLLKQREELNSSLAARGIKLSVNDMLIKAQALAMAATPDVNVQFSGDELFRFKRVDISMAVAIEGGLITPVIRDVGALSLSAIAQQSRALAERARAGKLTPEEYTGGTAAISNLGMFGIDEMFPVINPPQALILGIGAGVEQPWKIEGGGIGLATIMAATASFDHRAIDGATAAQFMAAFRDLIEHPLQILS